MKNEITKEQIEKTLSEVDNTIAEITGVKRISGKLLTKGVKVGDTQMYVEVNITKEPPIFCHYKWVKYVR